MRKQKTAQHFGGMAGHHAPQLSANFIYQPALLARAQQSHNYALQTATGAVGRHSTGQSAYQQNTNSAHDQFTSSMTGNYFFVGLIVLYKTLRIFFFVKYKYFC